MAIACFLDSVYEKVSPSSEVNEDIEFEAIVMLKLYFIATVSNMVSICRCASLQWISKA